MTDPRELLDTYAAGEHRDYSGAGQAFRLDRVAPKAFAALRDVLDAHRDVNGRGKCRACGFHYPCATVRLIAHALDPDGYVAPPLPESLEATDG